jgi:hypothetical protein
MDRAMCPPVRFGENPSGANLAGNGRSVIVLEMIIQSGQIDLRAIFKKVHYALTYACQQVRMRITVLHKITVSVNQHAEPQHYSLKWVGF